MGRFLKPSTRVPGWMNTLGFVGGLLQLTIVIIFCCFTEYDSSGYSEEQYGMFQDVNVMIMVGFGFLFCLLPRYGWSAVSIVMITAAMTVEWSTVCHGWILNEKNTNGNGFGWWPSKESATIAGTTNRQEGWWRINVTMDLIMNGVFAAASVLIALGCVLGRSSVQQTILMMFFFVPVYVGNQYILFNEIGARDTGGTMYIHCFGAFFGCAVSWMLGYNTKYDQKRKFNEDSNYNTNLLALIGTLFLWCYYPSFNAYAVTPDSEVAAGLSDMLGGKYRATFNTYLGLVGAAATVIILSDFSHENKDKMIHMQTGVLAGGVGIGCLADMYLEPWGALLMGSVTGICAWACIGWWTSFMEKKLQIHDTADCMALHGICAFISAFGSCVAFAANDKNRIYLTSQAGGSVSKMAGLQIGGIFATAAIAIAGGLVTGFIISLWGNDDHWYDDQAHFHEQTLDVRKSQFRGVKRRRSTSSSSRS